MIHTSLHRENLIFVMAINKIYTIGVYGYSEEQFFDLLVKHSIDLFIDIRMRRAVRGAKYAFVNSNRLQNKLKEFNIQYLHILELAPSKEIREAQKKEDEVKGIKKSEREVLGEKFIKEYTDKILNNFDCNRLIEKIGVLDCVKPVLFCVEGNPNACHRSLVVNRLHTDFHLPIQNL